MLEEYKGFWLYFGTVYWSICNNKGEEIARAFTKEQCKKMIDEGLVK